MRNCQLGQRRPKRNIGSRFLKITMRVTVHVRSIILKNSDFSRHVIEDAKGKGTTAFDVRVRAL